MLQRRKRGTEEKEEIKNKCEKPIYSGTTCKGEKSKCGKNSRAHGLSQPKGNRRAYPERWRRPQGGVSSCRESQGEGERRGSDGDKHAYGKVLVAVLGEIAHRLSVVKRGEGSDGAVGVPVWSL